MQNDSSRKLLSGLLLILNFSIMKKELLSFQISKEAMNELKGGTQPQRCHCGGGSDFITSGTTYDELEFLVGSICGNSGWVCTPV